MIRTINWTSCGGLWRTAQSRFFTFLSRLSQSAAQSYHFMGVIASCSLLLSFVDAESAHLAGHLLQGAPLLPSQIPIFKFICLALGTTCSLWAISWGLALLILSGFQFLLDPRATKEMTYFFTEWSQKIDTQVRIKNEVEQLNATTHHDPVKKSTPRRL